MILDDEHVNSVAAKLRDLMTSAPRHIVALDSTGHSRADDLALSELAWFAQRALDDAAVRLAHTAILKLVDQAS